MKALVVDGERESRQSLKSKLQARGYEVFTAGNAEEALNLCILNDVSLVVTASVLPEMSGFTLIERIARGRRDLALSFMVLLDRDERVVETLAKRSGARGFLMKPVTEEALSRLLPHDLLYTETGS